MQLDEASRDLLMKILEDATQEAVRRQAKVTCLFCVPLLITDGHTFRALFSGQMPMLIKFKMCLSADAIRFSSVPCARESSPRDQTAGHGMPIRA